MGVRRHAPTVASALFQTQVEKGGARRLLTTHWSAMLYQPEPEAAPTLWRLVPFTLVIETNGLAAGRHLATLCATFETLLGDLHETVEPLG